jgi:limonene-1,2-epoxide hydrolase
MRKFGNKALIAFYITFPLLLITSCAPKPADRLESLQKAINNHDIEKAMSFYADDIKVEILGTPIVIEGKQKVRKAIEEQIILNAHFTFTDIKADGNKVTYKVKEQNDWLKAAGVDALYYEHAQTTFKDGLIKLEIAKPTQESAKIMGELLESFGKWASEKKGKEYTRLKTEGVTKENVGKWLAIVQKWREKVKQENK